ncbi:hypothetical protein TNCT_545381 [Trichonephila clavata]|uniref:Uncharacterized protein n=1 Tax=Trichonephila clavata TaxID=2740835 RepID=A0A8X6HRF2_TRICU|nr:hypothetical protein TNCT_545381 [Trichonephila clavata]
MKFEHTGDWGICGLNTEYGFSNRRARDYESAQILEQMSFHHTHQNLFEFLLEQVLSRGHDLVLVSSRVSGVQVQIALKTHVLGPST